MALVKRHTEMVRWLCWIYSGGNAALCDDLVQDTMLALWQARGTLRDGASLLEEMAWVRFRCHSVLSHHRRKKWLETTSMDSIDIAADYADSKRSLIHELSEDLTPHEREVLELMLDGYQTDEIAAKFGIKRRSVNVMRHRIVEKLREASRKEKLIN